MSKMIISSRQFRAFVPALWLLGVTAIGPTALGASRVSPADPRLQYEGRFDFADTNAPVVVWQASRIRLDFEGDRVVLLFGQAKGQCFFNAEVDGTNTVLDIREGPPGASPALTGLGPGRHRLVLFKRSEANAGTAHFLGVELPPGAEAWAPAAKPSEFRMEFIGDSITVGACNEDGEVDQWENRRTHNAAASYAALTAEAFGADHQNISVSGMGVVAGWVPQRAGEVWDRIYPELESPRANLEDWKPRLVFINLGENDDSFSRAHGQAFPTNYTEAYVSLVRAVQSAYPQARIVLLRGGMFGGAQSEPLRKAWEAAVAKLEGSDKRVNHFVFKHWSKNHPRAAEDRKMADELIAWLRQQGWQ